MEKLIDMHVHSDYSDGEYSPDELINKAIKSNISILSITDHDSINGIKSIDKSKYKNIKIINGIELSAKVNHGRMHILGYDFDLNNKQLNDKMSSLRDNSLNGTLSIIEQIKRDYGIRFHYDDFKELINSNHNLGRPDVAKLCVKYGYASSIPDAFDKYLIDAYNKTRKTAKGIPKEECIKLILESGGIPVLAHPKSLELDKEELYSEVDYLKKCGLMGIEVYNSIHNPEDVKLYQEIARYFGLLVSGGTDYHGPIIKPNISLGTGINNNIKIKKLSILDSIS